MRKIRKKKKIVWLMFQHEKKKHQSEDQDHSTEHLVEVLHRSSLHKHTVTLLPLLGPS